MRCSAVFYLDNKLMLGLNPMTFLSLLPKFKAQKSRYLSITAFSVLGSEVRWL
ncbi:hypothetical protein KO116_03953 [Halomonas sp. KO116]|nr:hypothetical protein KO116_03953 [Halomonas sp. KO116]